MALVAILAGSGPVVGQLFDQQPDLAGTAFVNQAFPDFPDFNTFQVDDVVFASDVTIGSITCYFTFDGQLDGVPWPLDNMGTPFNGFINIFPDDGLLDTEDPTMGLVVDVMLEDVDVDNDGIFDFKSVTACGLNIELTAGTYWIGLTPDIDFGLFGQEFNFTSVAGVTGTEAFARNPGGGFAIGTDWITTALAFGAVGPVDLAMTILDGDEGACPSKGCDNPLGDLNGDGNVDLLDVAPFVQGLTNGDFICEGDVNQDGVFDLLDVAPFVALLTG